VAKLAGASQPLLPNVVSACMEIDWAKLDEHAASSTAPQQDAISPRIIRPRYLTLDKRMALLPT
jgi:hypothetical protein